MKTINKILTAAAATALSTSCVTYYTVIPEIHPDGSMTRTVYAEADSACLAGDLSSHPFLFEPGEFRLSDTSYRDTPASEEYAGLPYVKAAEHWDKKWGLFFSTYSYTCTFPGIDSWMPVRPDSLMSSAELERWYRNGTGHEQRRAGKMVPQRHRLARNERSGDICLPGRPL